MLSGLGLLFLGDEDLSRDTSHLDRGHSGGVPVWTGGKAGPAVRVQTEEVSPGPRLGRGGNVEAQPGPEAWPGGRCPVGVLRTVLFSGGLVQARPGPPEVSQRAQRVLLGLSCCLSRPSVCQPVPSVDPVGRGPGSGGCLRSSRFRVRGMVSEQVWGMGTRGNGDLGGREGSEGERWWGAREGPALPLTSCHGPARTVTPGCRG